jgi:hypothetical protein
MKKLLPLLLLIFSCDEANLESSGLGSDGTATQDTTIIQITQDTTIIQITQDTTIIVLDTIIYNYPPSVVITSPISQSLDSIAIIKVDAIDDTGISNVKFLIGGVLVFTDSLPPYEYEWEICSYSDGFYSVLAKAQDLDGIESHSELVEYGISGDYDCENICGGNKIYDCENICGGGKMLDMCGVCDADIANDCSNVTYECIGAQLAMELEINPLNLFRLLDWDNKEIELAKLSVSNLSYFHRLDYYIDYYGKLNNETVVQGQTYNTYNNPGQDRVFSNINFDPYTIKTHFIDGSFLYSLNTIGYLISGNYEIGLEIKHASTDEILCTVTLDSLYQTQ